MKLFDLNILIYAHRSDQLHHDFYRRKLESALASDEPCALSASVAAGFVRVVTQPKFPNGPTPLPQALSVIETLGECCSWLHPGTRNWQLTASLCREAKASGKIVSDAVHAALAIEHGATWISRDRDFRRFVPHGLRWEQWEPTESQ